MRILVLSPFLPHAEAEHGSGVYLHAFVGALAEQANVALVAYTTPEELATNRRPPTGVRATTLVALPRKSDLRGLERIAAPLRHLRAWTIERMPLVVAKFSTAAMDGALDRTFRRFRPDACLVELGIMARFLPALRAVPTVLTDHEAGDWVRARVGPFGLGSGRDQRLWQRHVERCYGVADLVQALNDPDAATLAARLGRPVEVRAPVVSIPPAAATPGTTPPRCLFLGDYSHHPNPPAATFLAREVLPRVRRVVADAELWLAGPRMTPDVRALADLPGVRNLGFVPDLAALLGSVTCIAAPVFAGSGSRIKVLTALAHGLPVVANRLGLRGVAAPPEAAIAADTPDDLAAAIARLLRSATAATAAGEAARRWAVANLSPTAVARAQVARLELLIRARRAAPPVD